MTEAPRVIRPLPERVVNKIAAGEVIERPAAVVKELVENSLDAGATRIDITVEQAGVKLLRIVDNGHGIPEEQIEIAFSRHATSKISSFDELDELYSYGFRGEALPSVASVSRLRMVSRAAGADSGTELVIEGGVVLSRKPIAAPPGTTIEVEDLFFNTPARRKFLKADSTETRHTARTATALALASHNVGFSFTSNAREVFSVPADQTLGDRVSQLLGKGRRFVEIKGESPLVSIDGFLGTPDMVANNRYGLYLFINGRYIFSPVLSHALRAAYGEMIPGGSYPVGAVLIGVNPRTLDVNVHPSKTEVRLSREREVHEAIRKMAKEALRQDGIIPSIPHTPEAASGGSVFAPSQEPPPAPHIPGIYSRPDDRLGVVGRTLESAIPPASSGAPGSVDPHTGEIHESAQPASPSTGPATGYRFIGRLGELYLLLQAGDDLYIVDQHTAHERVLYEETLARIDDSSVEAQALLFPANVELSPEQVALYDDSSEVLSKSGFVSEPFGGRTVKVEAIPSVMAKKSPEELFLRVLDDILSLRKTGYDIKKATAQSIACRAAVMAGDKLTDREAVHLIERLMACRDRYACPHGRPTFVKVDRQTLDKQFGRI